MSNRNSAKPLLIIWIVVYATISCSLSAAAVKWHDDFDTENPEAWHIVGSRSVWKIADGTLQAHVNRDWDVQYELYQFIAFPPPYRNFTVIINDFGGDKVRFGFCIGRHFPDTPEEDPFFYVFFPDEIRARRFDGKGSSHPFRVRLSREPRTRWNIDVLERMELHFNSGYFLLFVDGEYRTAFRDANFANVEILGFVLEGVNIANEWVGQGWAGSFTISGLDVSAEVRLTSTWAQLKGNQ